MEGDKAEMKEASEKFRLNIRKKQMEQILWRNRIQKPSSQHLTSSHIMLEEEKEEPLENPKEGFLPLNQHKRYFYRRKRGKKCWVCGSWRHLKRRCPKMKCFHCGGQGHFKKNCIFWELHLLIQILKNPEAKEYKQKEPQKAKACATNRMKEITFREEKGDHILVHKGQDLAVYIGDLPFENARRGFDPPRLPKWKMEKAIHEDIQISKLKLSDYLPHQCGKDGEVFDGHKFLTHCQIEHRSWCPSGSLINASPYRYWLLWYNDENYLRFMNWKGEIQYKKADPPWC